MSRTFPPPHERKGALFPSTPLAEAAKPLSPKLFTPSPNRYFFPRQKKPQNKNLPPPNQPPAPTHLPLTHPLLLPPPPRHTQPPHQQPPHPTRNRTPYTISASLNTPGRSHLTCLTTSSPVAPGPTFPVPAFPAAAVPTALHGPPRAYVTTQSWLRSGVAKGG